MNKTKIKLIAVLFFLFISLFGQSNCRIMTYNLLNYPNNASSRNPEFKKVLDAVDPDIVVVQEITSQNGVNLFLSDVLDERYQAGVFIDGFDTDNAIFYKDSLITFISNTPIYTDLRDISEFKLVYNFTSDTFYIFSVHLKASDGSTNEQQRLAEVNQLRFVTDNLPAGTDFMVAGDYNIYYSDEPAYQALLNQNNPGYFLDPINSPGHWNNNSSFAAIHTQSTRTTSFGGGATGGLDDRFDMILISQAVSDSGGISYTNGSYTPYGNDGNHFNLAINAGTNTAVSPEIADALHLSSDHLPVYADFQFNPLTSLREDQIPIPGAVKLYQNYPNPFNPSTVISFYLGESKEVELSVFNSLGQLVSTVFKGTAKAGLNEFNFDAKGLTSGVYIYSLKTAEKITTNKLMIIK